MRQGTWGLTAPTQGDSGAAEGHQGRRDQPHGHRQHAPVSSLAVPCRCSDNDDDDEGKRRQLTPRQPLGPRRRKQAARKSPSPPLLIILMTSDERHSKVTSAWRSCPSSAARTATALPGRRATASRLTSAASPSRRCTRRATPRIASAGSCRTGSRRSCLRVTRSSSAVGPSPLYPAVVSVLRN